MDLAAVALESAAFQASSAQIIHHDAAIGHRRGNNLVILAM